jgi:hypothetical protein
MVSDCFEFARKDRQAMSRTVAQSFESGRKLGNWKKIELYWRLT